MASFFGKFLGGNFVEEFIGRNYLKELFGRNILEEIFWEEFFERKIWGGILWEEIFNQTFLKLLVNFFLLTSNKIFFWCRFWIWLIWCSRLENLLMNWLEEVSVIRTPLWASKQVESKLWGTFNNYVFTILYVFFKLTNMNYVTILKLSVWKFSAIYHNVCPIFLQTMSSFIDSPYIGTVFPKIVILFWV